MKTIITLILTWLSLFVAISQNRNDVQRFLETTILSKGDIEVVEVSEKDSVHNPHQLIVRANGSLMLLSDNSKDYYLVPKKHQKQYYNLKEIETYLDGYFSPLHTGDYYLNGLGFKIKYTINGILKEDLLYYDDDIGKITQSMSELYYDFYEFRELLNQLELE